MGTKALSQLPVAQIAMAAFLAGGSLVAGLMVTEPPRGLGFYGIFVLMAVCVMVCTGLLLNRGRRLDSAVLIVLVGLVSLYVVLMLGIVSLHVLLVGDSNGGFVTHAAMVFLTCVAAATGVFLFSTGIAFEADGAVRTTLESEARAAAAKVRLMRLELRQYEFADFSRVSKKLRQIEDVLMHSRSRDERCEMYLALAVQLAEVYSSHKASVDPIELENSFMWI